MKEVNVKYSLMSRFSMRIICLFILSMIIGCSTVITKKYNYFTVNKQLEWGVLKTELTGTWSTEEGNDILGSPYELSLLFIPKLHEYNRIEIYNIKFRNIENGEIVYEYSTRFLQGLGSDDRFFFLFNKINLPYHDYDLTINYILMNNNTCKNIETNVRLKRNYSQNRIIRLWSRLMSV